MSLIIIAYLALVRQKEMLSSVLPDIELRTEFIYCGFVFAYLFAVENVK